MTTGVNLQLRLISYVNGNFQLPNGNYCNCPTGADCGNSGELTKCHVRFVFVVTVPGWGVHLSRLHKQKFHSIERLHGLDSFPCYEKHLFNSSSWLRTSNFPFSWKRISKYFFLYAYNFWREPARMIETAYFDLDAMGRLPMEESRKWSKDHIVLTKRKPVSS